MIQERNYVRQEERRLHPTELGKTVDGVLREHFPAIVDVAFTAEMEKRLDGIEEGTREYEPTIREWYDPFADTLSKAEANMERVKVPARDTGEVCPQCGEGSLVIREGKFGEFTGCSRYPECDYIKDRKSRRRADRRDVPAMRQAAGAQAGQARTLRRLLRLPDVPLHQGRRARGRRRRHGRSPRGAGRLPRLRQAAGAPQRSARQLRGVHRVPVLQVHPGGVEPGRLGAAARAPRPPARPAPTAASRWSSGRAGTAPSSAARGIPGCKYRPPKGAAAAKVGAT